MGLTSDARPALADTTRRDPLNAEAEPSGAAVTRSRGHYQDHNDVIMDMRVAQLLCSRLCHDLAGASGAIHNGMELINEDGGADPAALSLVAASAAQLNNRLAFYRVAFGLGGGANRTMAVGEARELARGVVASKRLDLDWRIEPREADGTNRFFPVDEIRLALGLVLIGADALPKGGALRVRCVRTAAGTEVTVVAQGARAGLREDLRAAMNPDVSPDSLTSRTVHGYFTTALARRLDAAVNVSSTNPDEVTLAVTMPRAWRADTIAFPAQGASA